MARSAPEDVEKLGSEAEDSAAEKDGDSIGDNSDQDMAGEPPEDRGEGDEGLTSETDDDERNDESDAEMPKGNFTKQGENGLGLGKATFAAKMAKEIGLDAGNPIKKRTARDQSEDDDQFTTGGAPAKKYKRPTIKEIQAKRPPLDCDVPMGQRLSDRELLAIAKNPKPYERHAAAPYAFNYRGLLYAKYRYIMDLQDKAGNQVITAEDKRPLLDSVPSQELYRNHPNVFNSHGQLRQRAPKANKDVHDGSTGIYVSPVTKPGERLIGDMNWHEPIKSVLTDQLAHNNGKVGKERTLKQRSELEQAALRNSEREAQVDKLEKAIIKINAGDIMKEKEELQKENDELHRQLVDLNTGYTNLLARYNNLQTQHRDLCLEYSHFRHSQKFQFDETMDPEFLAR